MIHRENSGTPSTWVLANRFVADSQAWLWRQVQLSNLTRPHVYCWERMGEGTYPTAGIPLTVVPFPAEHGIGQRRHLVRIRNSIRGNYFATFGAEKSWFLRQAMKHSPAAILCHFGYTSLRMLPVAEKLNVPLVAHFHGLDLSSGLRNRWYRWSLERCIGSFSAVVVVGSHQKQLVLDMGVPEDHVHLIPCGVPTQEFSPAVNPKDEVVRFICVSRLTDFKGVDRSIMAFSLVVSEMPGVRLTIVGDGPERTNLVALAVSLGVADQVDFAGSLPPSRVKRKLQESDVFLQHSLISKDGWVEGFGVSISEAAACGLPVVVTDCGGIHDQVLDGVTGFVTEQGDVRAFAHAMLVLSRDPAVRKRLGTAGRERVVRNFDTCLQVRKLEMVMLNAMGRPCAEL